MLMLILFIGWDSTIWCTFNSRFCIFVCIVQVSVNSWMPVCEAHRFPSSNYRSWWSLQSYRTQQLCLQGSWFSYLSSTFTLSFLPKFIDSFRNCSWYFLIPMSNIWYYGEGFLDWLVTLPMSRGVLCNCSGFEVDSWFCDRLKAHTSALYFLVANYYKIYDGRIV